MWSWWTFSWAAERKWRRRWHGVSGYSVSRTGALCVTAWASAPPSPRLLPAPPPNTTATPCLPTLSQSTLALHGKATRTKLVRRASTLTHAIAVRDPAAIVQKLERWLSRKTPRSPTSGGESSRDYTDLWPPPPHHLKATLADLCTHLHDNTPSHTHRHAHTLLHTYTNSQTDWAKGNKPRPFLSLFHPLQSFQQSHMVNLQGNCGVAFTVMPDCRPQFFLKKKLNNNCYYHDYFNC